MLSKNAFIPVIKVICAHGIRGAVRVFCFDEFDRKEQLFSSSKEAVKLVSFEKKDKHQAIVLLETIKDRNEAEKLKGVEFYQYINIEEDEILLRDLIGSDVIISNVGTARVTEVRNYGAGDLLELQYEGKTVLIPFLKRFFTKYESSPNVFSIEKDIFLSFLNL